MGIPKGEDMEKITLLLISLFVISSCVSMSPQKLNPQTYYKRDMLIEINGHKAEGTLVVPKADDYEIKAKFRGKGDLVTLQTCHREEQQEKLGKDEKILFIPVKGLEDAPGCFLEIAAFDHKGRHSWSLIDFENDLFQLPALIRCNGVVYNSRGVTICQSKQGLLQEIEFSEPVIQAESGSCGKLSSSTGMTLRYAIKPKICTYVFEGVESGKLHKLTTLGGEKIIVRKL